MPERSTVEIDGGAPRFLQWRWRAGTPAVASVEPGTTLRISVPDSSGGQLTADSERSDLDRLDFSRVDPAVGPIDVIGARVGDALIVDLLDIQPAAWGWSGIFPDFGLLKRRFGLDLTTWDLHDGVADVRRGFLRPVQLPLAPMVGVLGTAPATGEFPMIPPQAFGGNLDNRLHGVGSRVELPVLRPGAGLSVGDPHALQGDGEVCGTGIETPAVVTLRVSIEHGRRLTAPRASGPLPPRIPGRVVSASGVGGDLYRASQEAVESLLDALRAYGLRPEEAYLLTSLVGQLRIAEIVDEPNFVVTATFPESVARAVGATPDPNARR
ncbi:MAG TPA: acetamidase/formamidase family protein [Thermoplasmata archaeon]|nr:acetamidase/formamidase family protein [Thermoplasmata archaeon]